MKKNGLGASIATTKCQQVQLKVTFCANILCNAGIVEIKCRRNLCHATFYESTPEPELERPSIFQMMISRNWLIVVNCSCEMEWLMPSKCRISLFPLSNESFWFVSERNHFNIFKETKKDSKYIQNLYRLNSKCVLFFFNCSLFSIDRLQTTSLGIISVSTNVSSNVNVELMSMKMSYEK